MLPPAAAATTTTFLEVPLSQRVPLGLSGRVARATLTTAEIFPPRMVVTTRRRRRAGYLVAGGGACRLIGG